MENYVYLISGFICLVTVLTVVLRIKKMTGKNLPARFFFIHLIVASFYIVSDIFWGIVFVGRFETPTVLKDSITYICLGLEISMSFFWYEYCACHLDMLSDRKHKVHFVDVIPALMGLQLVFIDVSTDLFFYVKKDGSFISGAYFWVLWIFTAFYYIVTAVIYILNYSKEKKNYKKSRSLVVTIGAVIMILSTVLQGVLPIIPFISIGVMLEALVIFVHNVTVENEQDVLREHKEENVIRNMMINALSDEYEIILWIDINNHSFRSFSNTDLYKKIGMKVEGDDFFKALEGQTRLAVYPDDIPYVLENLSKENILKVLENQKQYAFIYRIKQDDEVLYYETKLVRGSMDISGNSIMLGIKNVDARERQELKRKQDIRDLEKKELEYRKALQKALENQNEIYAEILHMQTGGIIVTDLNNVINICNEAASDIFDMPINIMMKDAFPEVVSDCLGDSMQIITSKFDELKRNGGTVSYEFEVHHLDGKTTFIKADSKLTEMSKQSSVIITSLTDITSDKEMEQKLIILSETDGLTGLLNRNSGSERTEQFVKKNVSGMFCLIDVNNFKTINDTYGHPIGDEVLVAIAKCLKKAFRRKDILMRMGGDEFGVFAVDITTTAMGEKCISRLFEEIDKIKIEGADKLKVTVSLGAILCQDEQPRNYEMVYSFADEAMYSCKGFGENRFAFFEQRQL